MTTASDIATLTHLPGNFIKVKHDDRTIIRADAHVDGHWTGWDLRKPYGSERPTFATEAAAVQWVALNYQAYCALHIIANLHG